MDANYSNGSSVYHGLTANLKKRFGNHYEFLASYTWSHAIDDSTDLQSPLAPQDSYFPGAERSTSLFDQRHRMVFSGVYQSGKLSGAGFASRFFSNWTFAPILEVASGRPFNIITGNPDNFQFSPSTSRPNVVPAGTPATPCGPTVASSFSPTGFFQEPVMSSLPRAERRRCSPRRQLRPQRRPEAVDGIQRSANFAAHQLRRAHERGLDRRHVQYRQQVQRRRREPAVHQRGTADGGFRSAPVQFALKLNW